MNTKINSKIRESLNKELKRQQSHIELIASENYVSQAVLELNGSVLTNKYAEGYPGKRYYGGCEFIDEIESLGIQTAKELFHAEHANIQPHSGSQANDAAYKALLEPKDRVVAMSLDAGGHLTHGYPINFSGYTYDFRFYGVNKDTEQLDYQEIEQIVLEHKPKLIVAGASAYSRIIDFKKFKEIADKVGAYLMVDMAHIAGLVAAGVHPNPMEYADIVTTTTHKTLRGARGGLILCKQEFAKKVDSAVFPGSQGGPLENLIAGKTQALLEASTDEFKEYGKQIVKNTKALANVLQENGLRLVAGGSDNHLINVDIKSTLQITGKKAEKILESIGIICNKNMIPFDTEKPFYTSGIRLGTPAMTTRGFKEEEFKQVGLIIVSALKDQSEENLEKLAKQVVSLCEKFPIYQSIKY
ncbi:serine hydroxymethyltransferase [Mycoplasma capricolum]|uniref:Serine hydroxymethyltransferase n=2 Tax=Mycoplasma capricolum TaxID=2095 RepID=A0A9N7G8C6_MYCCC|nr:serine hydroxymethyltransferase [Mycoplasma capricolum]AJK51095.1 glycine hydroxymethyltransferase [Mycoplasma capricolum subsp. capripneumoniae 87001]KIM13704.1 serine hydroxymethyltransferase [Mycoplasma capricolum subsp. capricolum]QIN42107.1 serine hydroxymethyltransferase [Mycoplasma capricolum subsp. capripneumoniae]QIN42795.1 serine hydroxymethyltransferase [Mycoplasma capricolum subsp. capripneumoniae]QIN43487.1 serine hydroxymethyltransferase [Mycoplasma capricolum subsp. capripneu